MSASALYDGGRVHPRRAQALGLRVDPEHRRPDRRAQAPVRALSLDLLAQGRARGGEVLEHLRKSLDLSTQRLERVSA